MRTNNPALNDSVFNIKASDNSMSLQRTAFKCLFLTLIVMMVGAWSYNISMNNLIEIEPSVIETEGHIATLSYIPKEIHTLIWGGLLGGLIFGIITIFNPKIAMFTAPIYAICEGVCLGSFSTIFEYMYPGAVPVSVGITFGILFSLLLVYITGLIRPSENFKMGVVAATGGICVFYMAAIVMQFFGIDMPLIHETGIAGITLSVFVVVLATANLVLDFDFIEQGVKNQCPKYMEWYSAFGLLVTLVWLYLEVLKLVVKIMASNKND